MTETGSGESMLRATDWSFALFDKAIADVAQTRGSHRNEVLYQMAVNGAIAGAVACLSSGTTVIWSDDLSVGAFRVLCAKLQEAAVAELLDPDGLNVEDVAFVQAMKSEYENLRLEVSQQMGTDSLAPEQHARLKMHLVPMLRYCLRVKGQQQDTLMSSTTSSGIGGGSQSISQSPKVSSDQQISTSNPPPIDRAAAAAVLPPPLPQSPPQSLSSSGAPAAMTAEKSKKSCNTVPSTEFYFSTPNVPVSIEVLGGGAGFEVRHVSASCLHSMTVESSDDAGSPRRATVKTANSVSVCDEFAVDVMVHCRNGARLVIGVCPEDTPAWHCSRWVPGDRQLHGSMGLSIGEDNSIQLVKGDAVIARKEYPSGLHACVKVSVALRGGGQVRFAVNDDWIQGFSEMLLSSQPAWSCPHGHPVVERWVDDPAWTCERCQHTFPRGVGFVCDTCRTNMCSCVCSTVAEAATSVQQGDRRYSLAVGVFKDGQVVQLLRGRQWSFPPSWSASRVLDMGRTVQCVASTKFTQYTSETFLGNEYIDVTLEVDHHVSSGSVVSLGVLDARHTLECMNATLGTSGIPGSVCGSNILQGIFIMWGDSLLFLSQTVTTSPTYSIRMLIADGYLTFIIDNMDCTYNAELVRLDPTAKYRIGVSMGKEGQRATIGTEEDADFRRFRCHPPPSATPPPPPPPLPVVSAVPDSPQVMMPAQMMGSQPPQQAAAVEGVFVPNPHHPSVVCNDTLTLACCVQDHVSTIFMTHTIDMATTKEYFFTVRILSDPLPKPMVFGLLFHRASDGYEHQSIGSVDSIGLTALGHVVWDGQLVGEITNCKLSRNDVVSFGVIHGEVAWKINGTRVDLPDVVGTLPLPSAMRGGVSFNTRGQCVKVGNSTVSAEETEFLQTSGFAECCGGQGAPRSPPQPQSRARHADDTIDDHLESCKLSPEEVVVTYEDFLGKGGFASVYVGKWKGTTVAVKVMPWEVDERQRREISIGHSLTHPNIAKIHGWCRTSDDKLLIVMPLCAGTLEDVIGEFSKATRPQPDQGGPLRWETFFRISCGILKGLKYLATRTPPVLHRDLKPGNILMRDGEPQLTDFGLSTTILSANTQAGTLMYMSPEQIDGSEQTTATDIYSFACIVWQLLQLPRHPRDDCQGQSALIQQICDDIPLDMDGIPRTMRFIEGCFSRNAQARPSHESLLASMLDAARYHVVADEAYFQSLVQDALV